MSSRLSVGIRYGTVAFAIAGTLSFLLQRFTGYHPVIAAAAGALGPETILGVLLLGTFVGVWFEEFVFRWFPLRIARAVSNDPRVHWATAVLASLTFGYLHFYASVIHGQWQNIVIQGPAAFVLCAAYLRHGYIAAVLSHMTWNVLVITLLGILLVVPV